METLPFIGHSDKIQQFNTNLPPALLISGSSGVGKALVANWLAKKYTHEGCIFRLPKDNGLVDVKSVRELVSHFSVSPFVGLKIAIIDTDRISGEAINVLLKLLEEPPVWVRIILCNSTGGLPLTIKSRCVTVHLPNLTEHEVKSILITKLSIQSGTAEKLAHRSGGSVTRALELLSQESSLDKCATFLNACVTGNISIALKMTSEWDEDKTRILQQFFDGLYIFKQTKAVGLLGTEFFKLDYKLSISQIEQIQQLFFKDMRDSLRAIVICVWLMDFCSKR